MSLQGVMQISLSAANPLMQIHWNSFFTFFMLIWFIGPELGFQVQIFRFSIPVQTKKKQDLVLKELQNMNQSEISISSLTGLEKLTPHLSLITGFHFGNLLLFQFVYQGQHQAIFQTQFSY